jgi:DNA-binding transcriptional MocR family regulator
MDMAVSRFRDLLGNWAAGRGPAYLRLSRAIRQLVEDGLLEPGTRLPAERRLAEGLAVSRGTVAGAYDSLRRDGVVVSLRGSGTRVRLPEQRAAAHPDHLLTLLRRNPFFGGAIDETPVEYDLASAPSTATVITDLICEAAAAAAADVENLVRSHGYTTLGLPALRDAVARDLSARGLPTATDQILVTNGAQQALALVAAGFAQRGGTVIVDDPTSVGALDALAAADLQPIGVPIGEAGLDLELLRVAALRTRAQFAYVSATFQNPTGVVMPTPARRELVALATERQLPLIEDASLSDLSQTGALPPPLAAIASEAPVVTIGSLSSVLWGGLRIGWLRAPTTTIGPLARLKTAADIGTSLVGQLLAVHLYPRLDEVRKRRRETLETALQVTAELLDELVPEWSWREPRGGPFLWIELPSGSGSTFAQVAMRQRVSVVAGPLTSPAGNFDSHIRLRYAHDPDFLSRALRQLATAWRMYTAGGARGRAGTPEVRSPADGSACGT